MSEVENKESCKGDFVWVAMKLLRKDLKAEWSTRIDMTMDAVSEFYGIAKERILSTERTPQVISARQMAMYIARNRMGVSLSFVAKAFARTNATVLRGVMSMTRRLEAEPDFRKDVDKVVSLIASKFRKTP